MKLKITLLTLILNMVIGYSQKNSDATDNRFKIKLTYTLGAIYPIEFGNTALAKAHSANVGFTTTLGLLKYSNFSAGVGLDLVQYNVKNTDLIGIYNTSKHNSYFMFANYDYDLTDKFSITPQIGYGSSELVIRKDNSRRGSQDGKEFRIGSSINLNLNKHNAFCFSILYVNNNYNVNANEEIENFFRKSNSIQLGLVYRTK